MGILDGGQGDRAKWLKALCIKGLTLLAHLSSGLPLLTAEKARSNAKNALFEAENSCDEGKKKRR
jgi:hypothetical protein